MSLLASIASLFAAVIVLAHAAFSGALTAVGTVAKAIFFGVLLFVVMLVFGGSFRSRGADRKSPTTRKIRLPRGPYGPAAIA